MEKPKINWYGILAGVALYLLVSTFLEFLGIHSFFTRLIFIAVIVTFTLFMDTRKRKFKESHQGLKHDHNKTN